MKAVLARFLTTRVLVALGAVGLLLAILGLAWVSGIGTFRSVEAGLLSPQTDPAGGVDLTNLTALNQDTDRDGLADLLENYQYGTDPARWDSRGDGVPDGWLVKYGYDPLTTNATTTLAARPDLDDTPAVYGLRGLPDRYVLTLAETYSFKRPEDWNEAERGPWTGGLDPRKWDSGGSGIPDGWLVKNGLDPTVPRVGEITVPGDDLTVGEKYRTGTIPGVPDSDGDGLLDQAERTQHGTDPAKFSTSGSGIPDGWLVAFGLNPLDPNVAFEDPDRDGLSNGDEYRWSFETLGVDALTGAGLRPLEWNSGGSGIPDGWLVGHRLNPLDPSVADQVVQRASDFPEARDLDTIPDLALTVRDAYRHGRPAAWNEARDGVWYGGTNPTVPDTDGDGIPDAVEIRGWRVNVTYDVGPRAKSEAITVKGSPVTVDTDGDGLTDAEEFLGVAVRGEGTAAITRVFPPTDPGNRDTAFSGLTDYEKLFGFTLDGVFYEASYLHDGERKGLDPTKADSPGRFQKDGPAFRYWVNRSTNLPLEREYPYESLIKSTAEFAGRAPGATGTGLAQLQELLGPLGDIDGDKIPNAFDADSDEDGLQDGLEAFPEFYARAEEYSQLRARDPTDPANADTDGDSLGDGWEVRSATLDKATGQWNLNAARWSSLRDGVDDRHRNLDGDKFVWIKYEGTGASLRRVPQFVDFNASRHYQYFRETGTYIDPTRLSTADDGISDGWKAFWSRTYPSMALGGRGEAGTLVPTRAQVDASPLSSLTAATPLQAKPLAEFTYTRFNRTQTALPPPVGPGERIEQRYVLEGGASAWRITGTARFTLRDAYNLSRSASPSDGVEAVNPYLTDTDGDGMPDHWEIHYMSPEGPRPTVPDGHLDADADGLSNRDEYLTGNPAQRLYGSDPTDSDSDDGSALDFSEFVSGAVAALLDPTNDLALLRSDPDTDGDGVKNLRELQGWGGPEGATPGLFPKAVRTNLTNPDTDGDGLLDGTFGECNAPADTSACASLSPTSDLARRLLSLGIAHETRNGRLAFFGEVGSLPGNEVTSPTELSTLKNGIPDGWRTYYQLTAAAMAATDYLPSYNAYKPSWWSEEVHGPWWWGRPPTTVDRDALRLNDLDADGLDDGNGEDPFPAANHENIVLGETDPVRAKAKLDGLVDEALRIAAQKWGESAGDPHGARTFLATCPRAGTAGLVCDGDLDGIPDQDERAPTTLVNVKVNGQSPGSDRIVLDKGSTYTVTGTLVLAANPSIPIPNATVLASLFQAGNGSAVGAGFTDAAGRFSFPITLKPDHSVALPKNGLILNGALGGTVTWRTAPDLASLGDFTERAGQRRDNALLVWAYNTSATVTSGPHAHYNFTIPQGTGAPRHLNAVKGPEPVRFPARIESAATLQFEGLPETLAQGNTLSGRVKLMDAAGAPIPDRTVTLRWEGDGGRVREARGQVGRDGTLDLGSVTPRLLANATSPGQYTLRASYAGNPEAGIGAAAPLQVKLPIRFPTSLDAKGPGGAVLVGEMATFQGRLLESGRGHAGIVEGTLGTSRGIVSTRADGTFTLSLLVPPNLAPGRQLATLAFPGDSGYEPASFPVNLTVKGRGRILDLPEARALQGDTVEFKGRLVDNAGSAIGGARIDVSLGSQFLVALTTRDDGTFRTPIGLSREPGPVLVTARYAGDATREGTQNATTWIVSAPAKLTLEPYSKPVPRATTVGVKGRLVDTLGKPIAAQPVVVFIEGTDARLARVTLTNAQGVFEETLTVPGGMPLGLTRVTARYNGSADGVLGAASASERLQVQARTDLTVNFLRAFVGDNTVTGRLIDDRQNPVPGQRIALTFGTLQATATTDATGAYSAVLPVPASEPVGTRNVTANYAGNDRYAAARAVNFGGLVGRTTVTAVTDGVAVRTTNMSVTGRAFSETGIPLEGDVKVYIADRKLGDGKAVGGEYNVTFKVLTTVPVGEQTLRVEFTPRGFYSGSDTERPILVKARATLQTTLPKTINAGEPFEARVVLKDDGNKPLQDALVLFSLDGGEPVTVRTNSKGEATLVATAPAGMEAPRLTLRYRGTGVIAGTPTEAFVLTATVAPVPEGFPWALTGSGVALLLAAGGVFAWLRYRTRHVREVRRILDLGLERLNAGNEYEATIYLTYQALAKALTRFGVLHAASDTPGDLGRAFKQVIPESEPHLDAFIRLFEEVRYSERRAGRKERDLAIQSFRAIQGAVEARLRAVLATATLLL
ncbi:MAG TPA: DUF4129 domain-containing protein, partial [Candidatus Thermoplasmatota archaeon]|nr:DUF4129 domain-containing protein [Candidatus Thermoplasmatota archaeon]